MMKNFSIIVCILGFTYGLFQSLYIGDQAHSVMHQLYSGQYSIIAAMFLCTLLIKLPF